MKLLKFLKTASVVIFLIVAFGAAHNTLCMEKESGAKQSQAASTAIVTAVGAESGSSASAQAQVSQSKEELNKQLFDECEKEHASPAVVEKLLSDGADPEAQGGHGLTKEMPLHAAARNGHAEIVAMLLQAHASPNVRDDSGNTPLHVAVEAAYIKVLEILLDAQGIDPNIQDAYGNTPLSLAARHGHTPITELLIAHGARMPSASDTTIIDKQNTANATHTESRSQGKEIIAPAGEFSGEARFLSVARATMGPRIVLYRRILPWYIDIEISSPATVSIPHVQCPQAESSTQSGATEAASCTCSCAHMAAASALAQL